MADETKQEAKTLSKREQIELLQSEMQGEYADACKAIAEYVASAEIKAVAEKLVELRGSVIPGSVMDQHLNNVLMQLGQVAVTEFQARAAGVTR